LNAIGANLVHLAKVAGKKALLLLLLWLMVMIMMTMMDSRNGLGVDKKRVPGGSSRRAC
jgi:hypothetical protein